MSLSPTLPAQTTAPSGLMCELLAHPEMTEITDPHPEFSWIVPLAQPLKSDLQTACQILVASSLENLNRDLGDFWDSGRIASDRSVSVEYRGKSLASHTTYFWKVRTWNKDNRPSAYSKPQPFRTGALSDQYTTTRYPLLTTPIAPRRLLKKAPGHYFLDFGRAAFATIQLTLTSPDDSRQIEIHLGEVPNDSKDALNRKPGGTRRYRKMIQPLKKGTHTYKIAITPDRRNTGSRAIKMPPYTGEVMPFRYAEIVGCPSALTPSDVRQIAVHYPFDDDAAHFQSSSKVLDDVWQLCKYSMKATSFCGVYVDGDRERIPYEADAYLNQLSHYAADREFTLARYTHEYLITHPTWPTEWILHSVLMAWADWMTTGDDESIRRYYDDLQAKTLLALARPDGLISTQTGLVTPGVLKSIHFNGKLRDIVDWPHGGILGLKKGATGETDNFVFTPINTVVNAFHYRALILMSQMARHLEKSDEAARFVEAAAQVKRSFHAKLFDLDRGVYRDGETTGHVSLHGNMYPLAFGLVPPEHIKSVAAFIKSRGMVCSVYGSQYLLEALYNAGEDDFAFHLMTDTDSDRSWPHMIYNVGTTITLEAWDNKYKPNQDWNHAWGAAPANIIPRCLMGIRPLRPGFGKILIKPQTGPLTDASIKLPTVRGPIHVDFEAYPADAGYALEVILPGNTTARVCLPRRGLETTSARVDGKIQKGKPLGDFLIFDNIPSGRHAFELKK